MRLNNILVRYKPPGLGLEYSSNNSSVIITVSLENITNETNISDLTNEILKTYVESNGEYKDVILKAITKIQKFANQEKSSFVKSDILLTHLLPITNVSIDNNGNKFVTGSYDRICRIWDIGSGDQTQILDGHENVVYSVIFNKHGNKLLTGSYDKTSILWNLDNGKIEQTYRGHTAEIMGSQFASEGEEKICSISIDTTARIYNTETGQETLKCGAHDAAVVTVQICDSTMVTGSFDKTLALWDLRTNKCIKVLRGHTGEISSCKVDMDGLTVVSGSFDATAKLWDLRMMKCCHTYVGHGDEVLDIEYNWRENLIATASADCTARLWDCGSELCEREVLRGHLGPVLRLVFNPEGGELATCSEDGSVRTWHQVQSGDSSSWRPESILPHAAEVFTCLYTPTGDKLLTACKDNSCRIWSRSDRHLNNSKNDRNSTQRNASF